MLQCVAGAVVFYEVQQFVVLQCCRVYLCETFCFAALRATNKRGRGMMQCVAVCCRVLQYIAKRCRVLQSVAECCSALQSVSYSVLQSTTIYREVLQSVAECCLAWPRIASHKPNNRYHEMALQCVAVCCSVFPRRKRGCLRSCCSAL